MRRIVWSAVVAAVLAVAGIVMALVDMADASIALGLAAVTAAVLSNRDSR